MNPSARGSAPNDWQAVGHEAAEACPAVGDAGDLQAGGAFNPIDAVGDVDFFRLGVRRLAIDAHRMGWRGCGPLPA